VYCVALIHQICRGVVAAQGGTSRCVLLCFALVGQAGRGTAAGNRLAMVSCQQQHYHDIQDQVWLLLLRSLLLLSLLQRLAALAEYLVVKREQLGGYVLHICIAWGDGGPGLYRLSSQLLSTAACARLTAGIANAPLGKAGAWEVQFPMPCAV
jgi:hypothetical protein